MPGTVCASSKRQPLLPGGYSLNKPHSKDRESEQGQRGEVLCLGSHGSVIWITSSHLLDNTSPLTLPAISGSPAVVPCRLAPDCLLGMGTPRAGRATGGWQRAVAERARLGSWVRWREACPAPRPCLGGHARVQRHGEGSAVGGDGRGSRSQ